MNEGDMSSMRSTIKLCVLLLAVVVGFTSAGCQMIDKLKARDHLNNGVAAYQSKRYEESVTEFQAAIELDPELLDAYLYLGAAHRAQFIPMVPTPENLRKGQEAIATFEQVLEISPGNYRALANIADLYRNMNEPQKAKDWYRGLIEYPEHKAEALYGIGSIDYNLADEKTGKDGENVPNLSEEEIAEVNRVVDEAIDSLRQALEIRENYTDALEYLNLLYREKAELAEDDEVRRQWQREADKLALEALEMKRRLQREEERRRREIFTGVAQGESGD
jgi:tetratricopeptide (TPR) repeat protein